MRRTIIILLASLSVAGCAGIRPQLYRYAKPVVVIKPDGSVYAMVDESPGDAIGVIGHFVGDTVQSVGTREGGVGGGVHYMLLRGADTVFAKSGDVLSIKDYRMRHVASKFTLPTSADGAAWGRATVYVIKHSDMKIQTSSENLIQTFNPIGGADVGFIVTRVPGADNVEYEVTCISTNMYINKYIKAKECAYYMIYGEEYY